MRRNKLWIEIVGMGLILGALCWQLFLEDVLYRDAMYGKLHSINNRLLYIWNAILSGDPQQHVDKYTYSDFLHAQEIGGVILKKANTLATIRGAVFLLGSILLIICRYWELTDGKINSISSKIK